MNASKRQRMQVLHTWMISLRNKRKGTFMQRNYMKQYFVKYTLFFYNLVTDNGSVQVYGKGFVQKSASSVFLIPLQF